MFKKVNQLTLRKVTSNILANCMCVCTCILCAVYGIFFLVSSAWFYSARSRL